MSKVICLLPNASLLINNIVFEAYEGAEGVGVISAAEVEGEALEAFRTIPGYLIEGEAPVEPVSAPVAPSAASSAPVATAAAPKAPTVAEQHAAKTAEATKKRAEAKEAKKKADAEIQRIADEKFAADDAKRLEDEKATQEQGTDQSSPAAPGAADSAAADAATGAGEGSTTGSGEGSDSTPDPVF